MYNKLIPVPYITWILYYCNIHMYQFLIHYIFGNRRGTKVNGTSVTFCIIFLNLRHYQITELTGH